MRSPNRHEPSIFLLSNPPKSSGPLERAGFYIHHVKGSHYYVKHPDKPELRVTVPVHGSDLKRRTLMSIIDQSGLSIEEFLDLL